MPIFKWCAVDLKGKIYQGIDFAISTDELSQVLQYRQLGLMRSIQTRNDLYHNKIKISDQLIFFYDLRALVASGMPLPQALHLFLKRTLSPNLRCVVGYLLYQVQQQGVGFGLALQPFRIVFSNLVVVVLQSGFSVGNLAQALQNICDYLENKLQMQRELRRAIMMPILTLILFIIIACSVFVVIVPQFAAIFENAKIPLDETTRLVLNLSLFFRSRSALIWLLVGWLFSLLLYTLTKTHVGTKIVHMVLLSIPLFGKLIKYQSLFSFLQAASLLIDGGVPVVEAFEQASLSINNVILQQKAIGMTKLVEHGTAPSIAMQQVAPGFFVSDVVAMTTVGEESGCLGKMLGRVAIVYQQRFRTLLQLILSLVQPTLIIGLGLLVALLILAIYMPIFNMPAIIEG